MKRITLFMLAALVAVVSFAQGRKAPVLHSLPGQLHSRQHIAPKALQHRTLRKLPRKAEEELSANFVKVNSTPEDWSGQYLIVYEEAGLAMNGGLQDKLDAASNTISVSIENDEIAFTDAVYAASFTIAPSDAGGYGICSVSGLFMGWNSSEKNGLDSSADTVYPNQLSIDGEGNANIISESGSYLRYNASQGQERFRYFKASTYTNQKPVALYKLGGEHSEPAVGSLDLVVLPQGLDTEDYAMMMDGYVSGTANWDHETVNQTVQVAFDGSDVYIQGLSYWVPEAWVKGTLKGSQVQVPLTYMGADDYGYENYLIPYIFDATGEDVEDADYFVLDFDAQTGELTLNDDYIFAESDDPTAAEGWFDYWEELTLTPGQVEVDTEVELPQGVVPSEYVLTSTELSFEGDDEEEAQQPVFTPYETVIRVAFDGEDVYLQGFCNYQPKAWVKGTRQGNTITVPTGQYFGTYLYAGWFEFPMYFVGYDGATDQLVDVTFQVDEATRTLTAGQWIVNSGEKNDIDYFQILTDVVLTQPADVAATPMAPSVLDFEDWDEEAEYGSSLLSFPLKDINGNLLLPSRLFYSLFVDEDGQVSPFTFTTDLYRNLEEDTTVMPFSFDDDYDFAHNGTMLAVYFNAPTQSYTRLGVQSIYRGGGEENKSEISWYTIERDEVAIHAVQEDMLPQTPVVYNLAGQRVSQPKKGLYIMGGRKLLVK